MTRIREIAAELERWAPPGAAQSYDNVGLQIGDPDRTISRGLVALDFTPQVLKEAVEHGAELVITHHPLLFHPLKHLTPADWAGSLALRAAEARVALYSIHTNVDAAPGGISFALAERIGLRQTRLLEPLANSLLKLVTFVPPDHAETVRSAIGRAGAGHIGEYVNCAYELRGRGYFQPTEMASPYIGSPGGDLETVEEIRLEAEVSRWDLNNVVEALKAAHPYEEVAYDVYPVRQAHTRYGLGVIGELENSEPLDAFLERISTRLTSNNLRYVGDQDRAIKRVAVCGGSGSSLLKNAIAMGADAYVTADVTYHTYFDALDVHGNPRIAFIDAGHYETEKMGEDLLLERLQERFERVSWMKTGHKTSPIRMFGPGHAAVEYSKND